MAAASGAEFQEGPVHLGDRRFSDDATDLAASIGSSAGLRPTTTAPPGGIRSRLGLARRTLGLGLLMVTVCLWTASNFLASTIFSDGTYDKPFFVVYANSSLFAFSMLPRFTKYLIRNGFRGLQHDLGQMWHEQRHGKSASKTVEDVTADETVGERLLVEEDDELGRSVELSGVIPQERLDVRETAMLSLEFSMLWFLANYFASACLEHTSVASATILSSTSSVWTLIFCAVFVVERFTLRKLIGVLASLAGIALVSTVDLSGGSDQDRGSFPHKSTTEIAVGDFMALIGAVIYGLYVTVMKRRVGNEDRVDMRLFFGLVGIWTLLLFWPLFFVLHWTNIEPFALPPSARVWGIIFGNSLASFISDISWAFAMLMTTPLVVTVGISLTIPLSLIGEMIQYGQYASFLYWIGAAIVLLSFVFVSHESKDEPEKGTAIEIGPTRDAAQEEA
ncbi:unnamed protein product [Clonostachys byssicola]|uniref:EamA domain-containing protein n=1 Tax=Clonostachys byssicola TaxID=160290 RepID=A0A9N9Y8V8_9HYPO|nr:unnamed protein product [Clonostachys byssicola]